MNSVVKIKYLFILSDCLGRQKFCGMDVIPQNWSIDVIPQLWGMDVIPWLWGMDVINTFDLRYGCNTSDLSYGFYTSDLRYSGVETKSWIIVKKHITIMNLCFKNMGIIHTSARESWITRLWEKLIKIHVWINCVRPRECSIWRFWESNFQFPFSGGACPRTPLPPYIIRAFGADIQSARFSPVTWSLMFSYRKTPYLYKTNDDTASGWSRSLNGGENY